MLVSKMLGNAKAYDKVIKSIDELSEFACKYQYSLATFKDNYRNASNFIQAEAIGMDIDGGMTLDQAKDVCAEYKHLILPTRSHGIEKNGITCDRFRIILFLSKPITDLRTFAATWHSIYTLFPASDTACSDACRQFFPSRFEFMRNADGKLIDPVDPGPEVVKERIERPTSPIGKLSNKTLRFFAEGAENGGRHNALYAAARDAYQQGYTVEWFQGRIEDMVNQTGDQDFLNASSVDTIEDAFSKDPKHPPRIPEGSSTEQTENCFKVMSIGEAYKARTEKEWIVDNLLSVGGLSLIAGDPKAGKSTMIRQMVKDILRGSPFLGRKTKSASVLWLGFEEQAEDVSLGFKKLGIDENEPLSVHIGPVFADNIIDQLLEVLQSGKYGLVVVDTLFDLIMVESEKNYHEVKTQLSKLAAVARESRAHIICIHHTRKAQDNSQRGTSSILGSQAIFGKCDAALVLESTDDNGKDRILTAKGRGIKPFYKDRLKFNSEQLTYSLAVSEEY